MKHIYIIPIILIIGQWSCKQAPEATAPQTTTPTSTTTTGYHPLPAMTQEVFDQTLAKVSAVDYIFNNLPFSMNQSDPASIATNLSFISNERASAFKAKCQPLGREIFQAKGEIILEADIYFTPQCMAYVFIIDGKPAYANKISETGVNFYNNILTQVKVQSKG